LLPRAGMRRDNISLTQRLRSASLMRLSCASNAVADAAVLVGGVSCGTHVGPLLGHRHQCRVI
jgi:hypothetical protein